MYEKIVICDYGIAADGTDAAHIGAVLEGLGYNAIHVPRIGKEETIYEIYIQKPLVVVANPLTRSDGRLRIDEEFVGELENICHPSIKFVLFSKNPSDLSREDILDKGNHRLVVDTIENEVAKSVAVKQAEFHVGVRFIN
ncbi:hypothetical protein CMO88_02075 [Candidatus Woesearchaeota archaeon]|nr:hypothetical protein [Candidatus Woesearchaeota archaeon]|tara:strand:+ start:13065 stop:13484 length:420 start_codon:yes stop_codon:yes gene_type:complete